MKFLDRHKIFMHFKSSLPDTFHSFLTTSFRLQGMGFERGWGDGATKALEMMRLLLNILQAPNPSTLEAFLGRIPMVFNVVILSPHGYFGQANVLGLPDTGGQVSKTLIFFIILFFWLDLFGNTRSKINERFFFASSLLMRSLWVTISSYYVGYCMQIVYILDQVRALENEMLLRIHKQGLDVTPRLLIVCINQFITLLEHAIIAFSGTAICSWFSPFFFILIFVLSGY